MYGHHFSSSFRRHHHSHQHHHPYSRGEYLPEDFKKFKPLTFDGEMKKAKDVVTWLFGMNKLFRLHNYSENMKSKIDTFNLKGKAYIWWEDVNNFHPGRRVDLG